MRPYWSLRIEIATSSSCKNFVFTTWPVWICLYYVGILHCKTTDICDGENLKILITWETSLSFVCLSSLWYYNDPPAYIGVQNRFLANKLRKNKNHVMLVCSSVDGLHISFFIHDFHILDWLLFKTNLISTTVINILDKHSIFNL